MFQVKLMRPEDFFFATELANTMNWNMALEDFQYMRNLEPEGCFVLFEDSKPIGIATSISYGKVGWFGNLIVKEEHRRKGAGRLLLKQAVDYLRSKGAETIGLYAYPNLVNFYGNQGFKADKDFAVLHAQIPPTFAKEKLKQIGKRNIQAVTTFDMGCFGGDRKKLLESIILDEDNLGYFVSENGEVVGYAAAKIYRGMAEIGPLMCRSSRSDAALSLLCSLLSRLGNLDVYFYVPKESSPILNALLEIGFKEAFRVERMFLGPYVARNCIYLAESLERG